MSIVEKLKVCVEDALKTFNEGAVSQLVLIENCRHSQYGDFSCGVANRLSHGRNSEAFELAQKIASLLNMSPHASLFTVNVSAPGFINFNLSRNCLAEILVDLHRRFCKGDGLDEHRNPLFVDDVSLEDTYRLCCSLLRCATQPTFDLLNDTELAPFLSDQQWQKCKLEYKTNAEIFYAIFDEDPLLYGRQKSLILMLDRAIRSQSTASAREAVHSFAKFYQGSRVFTDRQDVTKARLGLVLAVKLGLETVIPPKS